MEKYSSQNEKLIRGLHRGFELSEEGISKLEDRMTEIIWSEELKERRMKKNEQNLRKR